MRINSILLKNYKPFSFSNIQTLQIEFVSPTTVIVGTNGSGKSALLRMLNPLPPVRTDFHPGGYKELHVTHEDKEYVLMSDFNNKNSPHSFVLDNVELNIGGTTGVQEELVLKHFGYTNLENSLLRTEIDICRMGKSERKNLFLVLNPTDLSLVLEIHKKTLSKIKEFKNNLTHLYKRKEEIESRMISIDTLTETKKHKNQLELQKNTLDKLIYALHQHLDHVKTLFKLSDQQVDMDAFQLKYQQFIKSTYAPLASFTSIDRVDPVAELQQIFVDSEKLSTQINTLQLQITDTHNELKEYEIHINAQNNKPLATIESEIMNLNKLIMNINIDNTCTVILQDESMESQFLNYIEYLKPKLFYLSTRTSNSKIWTNTIVQKVLNKLDFINRHINHLKSQIDTTNNDIKSVVNEQEKFSLGIPDNCNLNNCDLKIRYLSRKTNVDTNLKTLIDKREGYKTKITHLNKVYGILSGIYERHKPYIQETDDILTLWNRTTTLNQINLPHKLSHILNHVPLSILSHLEHVFDNSKNVKLRNDYMEKRNILQKEIDALIKANATSKDFMENLVKERTLKLNNLLVALDACKSELSTIQQNKNKLMEFLEFGKTLDTTYTQFQHEANLLIGYKTLEFYKKIIIASEAVKNEIDQDLRDNDLLIQEQDALRTRYDKEVMEQITLIETERHKYLGIEKELSPNTGLPHKHLVKLINGLIHNVNYFIAQVFSYPLKVSKLDINEPIDFALEVTVGDIRVKDISLLSKGQHEMMTIAWTLAILLQKNMLDKYPLFLDEIGGSFDPTHQGTLLELLKSLQDQKLVNQMFIINHQALYSEAFNLSDMIALRTDDTVLTNRVNEHVQFS